MFGGKNIMAKKGDGGLVLFLICFFLGWFGIDKLYKGSVKLFVSNFCLTFAS